MSSRGTLRKFAVAAVTVALVAVVPPASANDIVGETGDTGCGALNMHDGTDGVLSYRYVNLTSGVSAALNYSWTYNINPTDLGSFSTTSSSADVTAYDGEYTNVCGYSWWNSSTGTGVAGVAVCDVLVRSACDRHSVYFHAGYVSSATTSDDRKLACHELGHTLGITHNIHDSYLNSCMRSKTWTGTTGYSTHEINMINSFGD